MAARASAGLLAPRWNVLTRLTVVCLEVLMQKGDAALLFPLLLDRWIRAASNACLSRLLRGVGKGDVQVEEAQGSASCSCSSLGQSS